MRATPAALAVTSPRSRLEACKHLALVCRGKQGAARNDCEYKHATTLMCSIETHSFSFAILSFSRGGGEREAKKLLAVSLPKETEEKMLPAK